jgi:hypothetical protein
MSLSILSSPGAGGTDPQQGAQSPAGIVPGTAAKPGQAPMIGPGAAPQFSDAQLLEKFKRWKKESFDQRWIFERQWMQYVWYILNRQWIYFDSKRGQWMDKRLAKWIPRPVTNVLKDGVQAVRANLAAINYGTNARPLGDDNINVVTASVADDYAPILHEDHSMDAVLNEFDFWALVCGNAWLHTYVDYDIKNGSFDIQSETCNACGETSPSPAIAQAGQKCPSCGVNEGFTDAGSTKQALPKPTTIALSPFEIAFPMVYERFTLAPYCMRLRWRDKSHYEQSDALQQYARTLNFGKTPQERTMQIFKTLPFQNDLGIAPPYFASGGANAEAEGIAEYDVWIKPCKDFPEGQVIRFAGDSDPVVIHSDEEQLPGPLPFHNAKGDPLFPFHHARYESVGGRALGSSLISPAIGKQDQLNQLDSHILMVCGRMANPIWLEPKGAEVEKFTGEPGLVVKWNPLAANGNAKPERIAGAEVATSIFEYRKQLKEEIEELLGTNDLLKGQKPAGVEAYAAMALLVERGQAKHISYFKERGTAYKGWFKDALELEREFGPDERVRAIMSKSRGWSFNTFKKADLSGTIDIIIEDGTLSPKSALGERAAIEHLRQLGLLNPEDPDQVMEIFSRFGQSRLLPGLDAQVQESWMNMDRLEKFFEGDPDAVQYAKVATATHAKIAASQGLQPVSMGPLIYKRWYSPQIHRQELIKWALSDRGRQLFQTYPEAEMMVDAYLSQIDLAIAQLQMGQIDAAGVQMPTAPGAGGPPQGNPSPGGAAGGAGAAMANSNRNAGGAGPSSSGSAGTAPTGSNPNDKAGSPVQQAREDRAIQFLTHGGQQ